MKILNLASGSKGNSTYIRSLNTHILVDVGVSFNYLKSKLENIGVKIKDIEAVIITHEHGDHTKGLKQLLKGNPDIEIYAHIRTLKKISAEFSIPASNQNPITSADFYIKDITVSAFSVCHDASACLGFSFYENGFKFSIATDLGCFDENTINSLTGSDLVFIEANHDIDLLNKTEKYPGVLKRRILGTNGHLSNMDSAKIISRLISNGTKKFMLAHLSENTNTPELAFNTVSGYLNTLGVLSDEIVIGVLMQNQQSDLFSVGENA